VVAWYYNSFMFSDATIGAGVMGGVPMLYPMMMVCCVSVQRSDSVDGDVIFTMILFVATAFCVGFTVVIMVLPSIGMSFRYRDVITVIGSEDGCGCCCDSITLYSISYHPLYLSGTVTAVILFGTDAGTCACADADTDTGTCVRALHPSGSICRILSKVMTGGDNMAGHVVHIFIMFLERGKLDTLVTDDCAMLDVADGCGVACVSVLVSATLALSPMLVFSSGCSSICAPSSVSELLLLFVDASDTDRCMRLLFRRVLSHELHPERDLCRSIVTLLLPSLYPYCAQSS